MEHQTIVESPAPLIVYFSSVSENTHRFVEKLGLPAQRIPVYGDQGEQPLLIDRPYVLVSPTYGGGKTVAVTPTRSAADAPATGATSRGSVPKQVVRFLNNPVNRSLIRGVIAAGNTNFGEDFCLAGDIISRKCAVPYLYRFELMGTSDDVDRVRAGLADFAQSPEFTAAQPV